MLRSLLSSVVVFVIICMLAESSVQADDWTRFRGPNGGGVSKGEAELAAEVGPDKNVLWKIPLAKGHSSPVIVGGRVYLTAFRDRKLITLAVDAESGKLLWVREAKYKKLESFHRIGSPATPSITADSEVVVSFFGSSGMYAYSPQGKLLWHTPMGPFNNQFGSTSSPVLYGERLVTVQFHDTGSYLAALDKRTGKEVWRVERPNVRRNYGSPVIWRVDGKPQIVVAGTAEVSGYDAADGKLLWTVRGLCRVVSNTPVVGDDGRLYVASTGGGSTPPQPSFEDLLKTHDANKNQRLEKNELPNSPIKGFFGQFDRDANGSLDKTEYESIREIYRISRSIALAVKPGGSGDVGKTHVDWTNPRGIPRNSSPLYYAGHLYMVKDGGVISVLDAKTGKTVRQRRLPGRGKYFSSPIVADGKVYVADDRGTLSVIEAAPQLKQLHTAEFKEAILATPAVANGRLYLRTVKTLYCFSSK